MQQNNEVTLKTPVIGVFLRVDRLPAPCSVNIFNNSKSSNVIFQTKKLTAKIKYNIVETY